MRLLREATEGRRPKRVWPMFVAVPLVLAVLGLLGVYGFERKRQKEIANGREELLAASRRAGEALGSPPDWNQWFRSRVPENHGGPEFTAAMKAI